MSGDHSYFSQDLKMMLAEYHSKFRPLVKSDYPKNNFLISQPKYVLWVFKWTISMRLNETVLLSTQNIC